MSLGELQWDKQLACMSFFQKVFGFGILFFERGVAWSKSLNS